AADDETLLPRRRGRRCRGAGRAARPVRVRAGRGPRRAWRHVRPGRRLRAAEHERDHAVVARRRPGAREPGAVRGQPRPGLPQRHPPPGRARLAGERLHGAAAHRRPARAQAGRAVLLPRPDVRHELVGRALPDRSPGGLARDRPHRVLLLPGLGGGLLHRARRARARGPRLRRVPRRLHLRAQLLPGPARRPDRRGRDARPVPAEVRALPLRPGARRRAPAVPDHGDLGRPRGRGQLRRRQARRRHDEARHPVPAAAGERLPGVLRAHAAHPCPAGPEPDLRQRLARRHRRGVPARPAPVPHRPALQPRRLGVPRQRGVPDQREALRGGRDAPRRRADHVAARRAQALGLHVEGHRQPAHDHGARRRHAWTADQRRPVGRLRLQPRRAPELRRARGHQGRHVPHRGHPHVLHRAGRAERAHHRPGRTVTGSRRQRAVQRGAGRHRVRRRLDHVARPRRRVAGRGRHRPDRAGVRDRAARREPAHHLRRRRARRLRRARGEARRAARALPDPADDAGADERDRHERGVPRRGGNDRHRDLRRDVGDLPPV
ncbi:MAG: hypothetical protein AVDCRST_MAG85-81, partial [uncultured Solirubrobacteraceae bacterium]